MSRLSFSSKISIFNLENEKIFQIITLLQIIIQSHQVHIFWVCWPFIPKIGTLNRKSLDFKEEVFKLKLVFSKHE